MISLNSIELNSFSDKQTRAILWWKDSDYDGIICDGSVRSGKTLSLGLGFVMWAMASFNGASFAICGKTITSVRRNVITPLIPVWEEMGFVCRERVSRNQLEITAAGRKNTFYIFGGKDEGSAALIQGMTLAGVLFDEVVLMPRSFVEQALARCSVSGSKLWFNCNPDSPYHWFYSEWIKKARKKNILYLHFTMEDNPSLSDRIRRRYMSMYSGAFYDRFVLGQWTSASGLVYPMFDKNTMLFDSMSPPECTRFVVSADYGTINPASFGLWGYSDGRWYRLKEYYYSSRRSGMLRTDEEHYEALERLCDGYDIETVIVDPSAASFIECIRRHGVFSVRHAENSVLNGIRRVSDALLSGRILFSSSCLDTIREFSIYVWDEKSGNDCPVKENDHAMDDIRYFVNTVLCRDEKDDGFFVMSLGRR